MSSKYRLILDPNENFRQHLNNDDELLLAPEPSIDFCYPVIHASGGTLFYYFQEGDNGYVAGEEHGLIAWGNGSLLGRHWGTITTNVPNALNQGIGWGSYNTDQILLVDSSAPAALYCKNLSITEDGVTYDDWFLPNWGEMRQAIIVGGKWPPLIPSEEHSYCINRMDLATWHWTSNQGTSFASVAFALWTTAYTGSWSESYLLHLESSKINANWEILPMRYF